ncbi:NAD(P)-dependent dehydrogenase (short-subunit alcohol dehydrogenase family) [Streptomyces sp. T12]|uniref:SDR family NAD(P)-dependent oxidoreductase n=1 Tax=Streptomyces sp. T12 TaxID=477697 RepID=UPI0011AA4F5E|nr:SDR family NAD(P)-dependent oxidoreductase [Streptomyces sp. T12]TWD17622.1 NAD(P)-dependent dehydrogenase (short-subunit alcohol dehydrogenase family) [Streptomyces sp. T12]
MSDPSSLLPAMRTPFHARTTASEVLEGIDLSGRRAVVTGGSSGIGAETVRALATAGAAVTVATRRPELTDFLIRELRTVPQAGPVHAVELDLADLSSVASFVQQWHGPLDMLVGNAGIMAVPSLHLNDQGWELQLATNFLGHFALATGLHPALRQAGEARIVMVSSGAHRKIPFDFEDPNFQRRSYDPWSAYGQSKTADILFARGARRWTDDGIAANSMNPGFIITNLQRHLSDEALRAAGVTKVDGKLVAPAHFKSPAQGAATSVLLAASPLVRGVTGLYFEDNQEAQVVQGDEDQTSGVAAHALDKDSADKLWDLAEAALA